MITLLIARTFREAVVALVAARVAAPVPRPSIGRIESATKLVLGMTEPQDDGSILVGSSTDPLKAYHLVGTTCTCQDFERGQAPEGWCQHRIAAGIQKRVRAARAGCPGSSGHPARRAGAWRRCRPQTGSIHGISS